MATRVVIVGIGGASCSGKTLLAKHICRLLPNAVLIHQDDFAPTSDNIPIHSVHGVQDWDDPRTCIDWPRMREALAYIRETGALPEGYTSYDHLNKQVEVGVDRVAAEAWRERLEDLQAAGKGSILWVLVDGFVLYYDSVVADELDVKILLRVPKDTLRRRREARATYVLQHADEAAAGGVWEDPPNYFDNIVYPAYVTAHAGVFQDDDVENGAVNPSSGVMLIDLPEGEEGMTKALREACATIEAAAEDGRGAVVPGAETGA